MELFFLNNISLIIDFINLRKTSNFETFSNICKEFFFESFSKKKFCFNDSS